MVFENIVKIASEIEVSKPLVSSPTTEILSRSGLIIGGIFSGILIMLEMTDDVLQAHGLSWLFDNADGSAIKHYITINIYFI